MLSLYDLNLHRETSLVFLNLWFLLKHTSLKERQPNSCFNLLNSITWLMSVLPGTSLLSNKPAQCCTNWRRKKQSQGVLPGAWRNIDNPHWSSPKDAHNKECNNSTWRSRGEKKQNTSAGGLQNQQFTCTEVLDEENLYCHPTFQTYSTIKVVLEPLEKYLSLKKKCSIFLQMWLQEGNWEISQKDGRFERERGGAGGGVVNKKNKSKNSI